MSVGEVRFGHCGVLACEGGGVLQKTVCVCGVWCVVRGVRCVCDRPPVAPMTGTWTVEQARRQENALYSEHKRGQAVQHTSARAIRLDAPLR